MPRKEGHHPVERGYHRSIINPIVFVLTTESSRARPVVDATTQEPIKPDELWIEEYCTWVRLDGRWVSGWRGKTYFAFRPQLIDRWRIRFAARAWRRWLKAHDEFWRRFHNGE